MKVFVCTLCLAMAFVVDSIAQDIIVFKNGDAQQVEIVKSSENQIQFRMYGDSTNVIYIVMPKDVFSIVHKDGRKTIIGEKSKSEIVPLYDEGKDTVLIYRNVKREQVRWLAESPSRIYTSRPGKTDNWIQSVSKAHLMPTDTIRWHPQRSVIHKRIEPNPRKTKYETRWGSFWAAYRTMPDAMRATEVYDYNKYYTYSDCVLFHGFNIGFDEHILLTRKVPLYFKMGISLGYLMAEYEDQVQAKLLRLEVPLSVAYAFSARGVMLQPFTGISMILHPMAKEKMACAHRWQDSGYAKILPSWHIGLECSYRRFYWGVTYSLDLMDSLEVYYTTLPDVKALSERLHALDFKIGVRF